MKRILIVAGEASADRYGAALARKLAGPGRRGSLEIFGTGGDAMCAEGVHVLRHIKELANIGPREALSHLGRYVQTFRLLLAECRRDPPAVAVLLDFPDFNLRLAKKLKRAGIAVVYYISPQLWAWRRGRIRTVRRYVDKMLVILPFEEEFYRRNGVDAQFVGHPILEGFAPKFDREAFLGGLGFDPAIPTVALLAGSRRKEVEYILPTLIRASLEILERMPAQFLISAAPMLDSGDVNRTAGSALGGSRKWNSFRIVSDDSRNILANSDFAMVKSGTSTLEAALVGTPFLVTYKISPISWFLGSMLIPNGFKGLVNLIAREAIVPEYMQGKATPEALSQAALQYLQNPGKAAAMRAHLARVREMLGARCASDHVAATVKRYLQDTI
jgi:lipid-A-disaccharide synthase